MVLDIKENTRAGEQGSFELEHEDKVCPLLQIASMLCVRKKISSVVTVYSQGLWKAGASCSFSQCFSSRALPNKARGSAGLLTQCLFTAQTNGYYIRTSTRQLNLICENMLLAYYILHRV